MQNSVQLFYTTTLTPLTISLRLIIWTILSISSLPRKFSRITLSISLLLRYLIHLTLCFSISTAYHWYPISTPSAPMPSSSSTLSFHTRSSLDHPTHIILPLSSSSPPLILLPLSPAWSLFTLDIFSAKIKLGRNLARWQFTHVNVYCLLTTIQNSIANLREELTLFGSKFSWWNKQFFSRLRVKPLLPCSGARAEPKLGYWLTVVVIGEYQEEVHVLKDGLSVLSKSFSLSHILLLLLLFSEIWSVVSHLINKHSCPNVFEQIYKFVGARTYRRYSYQLVPESIHEKNFKYHGTRGKVINTHEANQISHTKAKHRQWVA